MHLRLSALILIGIFLFSIYFKVGVVVLYHLFKKQIAEAACINKLRDAKCQGKCYLKKQSEDQSTHTTPFTFSKLEVSYFLIPELPAIPSFAWFERSFEKTWLYSDRLSEGIKQKIKAPPKIA